MSEDEFLNRKQAAIYLTRLGVAISPKTLGNLASNMNSGKGPSFVKIGWMQVRYRRRELESWAKSRMKEIR